MSLGRTVAGLLARILEIIMSENLSKLIGLNSPKEGDWVLGMRLRKKVLEFW